MVDKCELEPGEICSNGTRLALLEKRIEALEDGQSREEAFRKTYYSDREDRIQRDTELDAKFDGMNQKLDKLLKWQEEQQAKPAKLLDSIAGKIISLVVAAAVGFLLARLGL